MHRRLASIVLCAAMVPVAASQTTSSDAATLYQSKCAVCHAANGAGKSMMKNTDLRRPELQQQSDAQLQDAVTNGRDKMPSYKDKLNNEQIAALVAYIRTLAGPAKRSATDKASSTETKIRSAAQPSATTTNTAEKVTGQTASQAGGCDNLPNFSALKAALAAATSTETSGLNNHMWATIVDRDGVVCAVAFSGLDRGAQWPGSRVISAQKANTANAFSLDSTSSSGGSGEANGLALSTANLYSAVQPGGSLFGLQESNPVESTVAYGGSPSDYGTAKDPMAGHRNGGINVFGGGLALYGQGKRIVGGVGVSGDTSCADHNIAWRVRNNLGLDHLSGVAGVSGDPARPDNIVFDITPNPNGGSGISAGGFGHPTCPNTSGSSTLPPVQP